MSVNLKELRASCSSSIEHLKAEFGKMRSGRASTGLLEGVHVDYYGSQVPLIQMGLVNAPEPRLITVQVYDASAVEAVEKAIMQADLGLNPSREGALLRIVIPALTEERRKDLTKRIHKLGEETKVALRNHRRDCIDGLKKREKAKEISEDDLRRGQEEVQKIIDEHVKLVDDVVAKKEKELLEV
jgi:ribosome recycling factor